MKKCPACQQNNSDEAAFCIHCGHAFDSHAARQGQPLGAASSTVPASPQSTALRQAAAPAFSPAPLVHSPLTLGSIVDNKYELERVLGEGGMGVVYVARDIHTQTPVVIKAIRTEYSHRKDFRDRILAEGRALARIDHPNVVRLNAVVVEPGALYLVMQYIEGESLDKRIERYVASRTPMSLTEALRIFRQVLEGVGAAHREGVIHRDIKAANILIRARDGTAKVTDFGIAKAEEDAKAGRGQTKGIIGSLLYMAPEQITGRRDLDKRVDIYGLGILLFEMLMGRVPFDGPNEFDIMKLHLEGAMPRIAMARADVPSFIDELIQKACAKDREQRFSSTDEFLAALDRALAAPAPPVMRPSIVQPMPSPRMSMPSPIAASTAAGEPGLGVAWSPEAHNAVEATHDEPAPRSVRGSSPFSGLLFGGLAVVTVALGAGFGLAYANGWFGDQPKPVRPAVQPPTSVAQLAPSTPPSRQVPVVTNPLALLVGAWRSESGRIYDAVLSGNTLEFRIRDVEPFQAQGYAQGEARFSLIPVPNESNTFNVEDKIRPLPPEGRSYSSEARSTCQEIWSSVGGRPLRAQYDGQRLTVDLAKVEPTLAMFRVEGSKVLGCSGLARSKSSRIESTLTRL